MSEDRVGWVCPECKKILSPDVKSCNCKKETNESSSTTNKILLTEFEQKK